jgi:hypothetical protein
LRFLVPAAVARKLAMRRFANLAPLLAALLLVTALAQGVAHGQMLRGDALAWLDICAEDEGTGAGPCLKCSLATGMAVGWAGACRETAQVPVRPVGGHLFASPAGCAGGGARAPPEWI